MRAPFCFRQRELRRADEGEVSMIGESRVRSGAGIGRSSMLLARWYLRLCLSCFGCPCAGTTKTSLGGGALSSGGERVNCHPLQSQLGMESGSKTCGALGKAGRGDLPSTRTRQATCGSMYLPSMHTPRQDPSPIDGRERARVEGKTHITAWMARFPFSAPSHLPPRHALPQSAWPRTWPRR